MCCVKRGTVNRNIRKTTKIQRKNWNVNKMRFKHLQQSIDAMNSRPNRFAVSAVGEFTHFGELRLQLVHIYPAAVPTIIIRKVQLAKHIFDRQSGIQIIHDTTTNDAGIYRIMSVQKLFWRLIKYSQQKKIY